MCMSFATNVQFTSSLAESNLLYDHFFDFKQESKDEDKSTRYTTSDTDRKDAFGNSIRKGLKTFKVSFLDEMEEKEDEDFVKVIKVTSYKKLNKFLEYLDHNEEEDSNEEDLGDGYDVISEDEGALPETHGDCINKDEGILSSCRLV